MLRRNRFFSLFIIGNWNCILGPMAADRYELLDMSKEQSLLEQIIQQAQHFFMRRRSEYVLDTIAKEVSCTKWENVYLGFRVVTTCKTNQTQQRSYNDNSV